MPGFLRMVKVTRAAGEWQDCRDKQEELLQVFPAPAAPFPEELRAPCPVQGFRKASLFSSFLP